MKQVNFSNPGGFPLEQETLERLQTAYRSELYDAIKKHLSIETNVNYIIAPASANSKGWAVIHQDETDEEETPVGILYPIEKAAPTSFLKTTREATNLIYGDGSSQTAYYDYKAEYVSALGTPVTNEFETVRYYDLTDFKIVKDLKAIETILDSINANITVVEGNIQSIENEINTINQSYLPINGSKPMEGDLKLGSHHLYLNNLNIGASNDFLSLDSSNQVVKNNTIIASLIERITTLEGKQSTAVPIGMIAMWGKPAPFPEGWEEYVPLRGRMPIGLNTNDTTFNTLLGSGGNKDKKLLIEELPKHYHHKPGSPFKSFVAHASEYGQESSSKAGFDSVDADTEIAIGHLGNNYKENGDALEQTVGNDQSFSILNPYRVVHFIEYTGGPKDPTTPTDPTDSITISNLATRSLTLNWTALNSQFEPTNYLVFQDNDLIASLGNVRSYNVTGLTPETYYNFHLVAKDATGTLSFISAMIGTTTLVDNIPPTAPTLVRGTLQGENRIGVEWNIGTDNEGVVGYEVWRRESNTEYELIVTTQDPFFIDLNVSKYNTYYYKIKAIDAAENVSDFSMEAEVKANPDILDE